MILQFIKDNFGNTFDGVFFGLGLLLVYLGAVLTSAIIRALGGVGSKGMSFAGQYVLGWFEYVRADDRNTINATLYMPVAGTIKADTLIADRRIWAIWTNAYRMYLVKRGATQTTEGNPVILLNGHRPKPKGFGEYLLKLVAGKRVMEDDYRAVYAPLISLISEQCAHSGAIDVALGYSLTEYRFVVALTFEQANHVRTRRVRAVVMWEEALKMLSNKCPEGFDPVRHKTLLSIKQQYQLFPERFGIFRVWR